LLPRDRGTRPLVADIAHDREDDATLVVLAAD
jgi:hypothetical protein